MPKYLTCEQEYNGLKQGAQVCVRLKESDELCHGQVVRVEVLSKLLYVDTVKDVSLSIRYNDIEWVELFD